MPEVWEQEGHLRARPCFRGDIEEELKRVDVDSQHTEAARTTTWSTAPAKTTDATSTKKCLSLPTPSQNADTGEDGKVAGCDARF